MRRLLLLAAVLVLWTSRPAVAQEADFREDLRFAEMLRARGDNDLALEFLTKLAKTAPPELLKELPLEFAKTGLRVAGEEAETARRLALYRDARENFQKFIDANPNHPRVAEANVDIARVLNLQGKTELGQALLAEEVKTKKELAAQARRTLELAATKLKAAEEVQEKALAGLPDPESFSEAKKKKEAEAVRFHAEDELKQTQFELAMNLYDQSSTFIGGSGDEVASKLLEKARDLLRHLADGTPNQPITWKARAWLGRILFEIETADKARAKFNEIADASNKPAAYEGWRLARYFRLLVIRKQPNEADKKKGVNAVIKDGATRWRNDYPRFLKTPEGFGITFMLAQNYLEDAARKEAAKNKGAADADRKIARTLLSEVERSENEFTDQAKRLKIEIIAAQGGFKIPVARLASFEDCYVRAQYEMMQLAKDSAKQRKARIDTILATLRRGLAMPAVKKMKASLELNVARTMLAYWALNAGKLNEAITVGETFARTDPRSSQAEMAAVYALDAYSQLLDQKKSKFEDLAEDRARMFSLAQYMEERWPKGLPGDLARHTAGLQFLKEGAFAEGIKKLSLVSPNYTSFTLARYQLADAALKADKDGSIEPIAGDRPGDYRKRALAALQSMPESALGSNPVTNQVFFFGKAILGREMFKYQRFGQMDDLANNLLGRLEKLRFSDDDAQDRTTRNQLRYELVDLTLFARYGLADQAFRAGDHPLAAKLLDTIVDHVNKADESQEKINLQKNPQLAFAMLSIALKSNIQLGKIDRTDLVLDVLDKTAAEAGDASTTNILKLLAFLIRGQVEEVRKKGDKDELARAIKGYAAILDKRIKKQKTLTPEFTRVLADCYSSMEEHEKAAAELAKVQAPAGKANADEERTYRNVQREMIRELRLSNTKDSLAKARTVMDSILGPEKKPSWGRKDISVLKEHGLLLEAEEEHMKAFNHWKYLTQNLSRRATASDQVKENFLECYYHMVYCSLKLGMNEPTKVQRDRAIHQAAVQIAQLEHSWPDFGSDSSKKRFTALLSSDQSLMEQYVAAKKKVR